MNSVRVLARYKLAANDMDTHMFFQKISFLVLLLLKSFFTVPDRVESPVREKSVKFNLIHRNTCICPETSAEPT